MNNEYNYILFLARSFFLQSLSLFNRRSERQQTSADRQNTEVYFEYCLSRWMHIIRRITAVASVALGVLCGLKLVAIRVNSWFNQNMKTKPKQTQFKPKRTQFFGGFWRKNFNFSLKIDDTKLNFLCKTKPIYDNERWSMTHQKTLKMQNEPNGMLYIN